MQKSQLGRNLSIGIAIAPAVLWLAFTPTRTDPIIKLAALSALSLLAWNIILSARLPRLETLFFGLDRQYRAHRMIGGTIVMLLITHASLLTLKYLKISEISAYKFILPSTEWALMAGKLGLYVLVCLVALTLYFKVRYQWFVLSMRVLGVVIFLGGYHALFVSGSDVRRNLPLYLYLVLIGGTAAALYIYRSLFHGKTAKHFAYTVEKLIPHEQVTEIWLRPVARPLNRYAGQFAFVTFMSKNVPKETHPFTIALGSGDQRLRFCIKKLGDFTNTLPNLKVGDRADIEGPFGYFSHTKIVSNKQTWVAGGIGITPFLAMAHSLSSGTQVTLFYCVKNKNEAIFLKELLAISSQNPYFTVITHLSETDGPITAEEIAATNALDYLLCGPPPMMHALQKDLGKRQVNRQQVHFEEFSL